MTGTGYSLTQSMKLGQTMAPQMRQSLKMLQMTSLELRAELQHQMEQNPVIEDVRSPLERQMSSALPEEHAGAAVTERELDFTPGGEAAQTTLANDDGYRDYFLGNMESASGDEEAQSRRQHLFDSLTRAESLQEHLKAQVPLSDIPPEDRELAVMLISHVDDDGYFRGSIPDIQMVTGKSEQHILGVLSAIQEFDPLGCGARDLRECLLAQMERLDDSPWEDEVRALIDRHLPDVAARREGFLCQALGITPEEYRKVLAELRTLNPKPGFAIRPPNVALSRRLSWIQADTLPHKTRIKLSCRLSSSSQPFFRKPGKSGACRPIQEISSRRTTVFLRPSIRSPSSRKASGQDDGTTRAPRVWAHRRSPKLRSWSASVCPFRGPSPSITMNSVRFRRANSRNNVDLPMRRRPRHATSDAVGLSNSSRSDSNSFSRPRNMVLFPFRCEADSLENRDECQDKLARNCFRIDFVPNLYPMKLARNDLATPTRGADGYGAA